MRKRRRTPSYVAMPSVHWKIQLMTTALSFESKRDAKIIISSQSRESHWYQLLCSKLPQRSRSHSETCISGAPFTQLGGKIKRYFEAQFYSKGSLQKSSCLDQHLALPRGSDLPNPLFKGASRMLLPNCTPTNTTFGSQPLIRILTAVAAPFLLTLLPLLKRSRLVHPPQLVSLPTHLSVPPSLPGRPWEWMARTICLSCCSPAVLLRLLLFFTVANPVACLMFVSTLHQSAT